MRPVSGEDLVTAALQSSLARAQKNYKLSNKQLSCKDGGGSSAKFDGGVAAAGRKSRELKFQSEFDLWIEQATEFTFTSEGYTNGAAIPEDIECLNSSSPLVNNKALKVKKQNSVLESVLPKKGEKNGSGGESSGGGLLKGKDKSKTGLVSENSFEIFKRLKENRKEKKKVIKLKKKLLRQGHSVEEAEKLIVEAKSVGGLGGAIQNKKQGTLVDSSNSKNKGKENSFFEQQQIAKVNQNQKKIKMKDFMENGESSSTSSSSTNPSSSSSPAMNGGGCSASRESNGSNQPLQLPQPKRVLYPREKIIPGYIEKTPVGAGFYNMGNSCYLNASLQAVFHVPAFINWLRSDAEHRKHCQDNGIVNCIVCAMKKTLDSALSRQNPQNAIRPVEIINRLRSICRHFSHGRQEDAHEFLRYLFESMERSYLAAINCLRLDNRSKETNPLGQIFGGYIRTEVTCSKCHYVSTTFQPTAELQLDIRHVTTLEEALNQHFKKERLDNNDYKCEKCRTISQATKQFSLEVPPIVLCLQLKRFTLYGTKIAKRIHCNRHLNMYKYMHKSKQINGCSDLRYRLVALVTHLGSSPNCGHYTAIAEASNGMFYQFDDSFVHQVTVSNALNNDAYVIIYEMDRRPYKSPESSQSSSSSGYSSNVSGLSGYPSSTVTSSHGSSSSSATNILYPKKLPSSIPKMGSTQSKLVHNSENTETKNNGLTNGVSTSSTSTEKVNGSIGPSASSRLGLQNRKMISFGINRPLSQPATIPLGTPNKITILKPGASLTGKSGLCLNGNKSKAGNSVASPSLPAASSSRENKPDQAIKLVPYNDDDNEESDNDGRVLSNSKRLKTPEKHSPLRNNELPVSPPKSPKPQPAAISNSSATSTATSSAVEASTLKEESTTSRDMPDLAEAAASSSKADSNGQKEVMKRKAPTDEETPRKSRSHNRRRSSTSSSRSSSSSSTRSEGSRKSSNSKKSKRKREGVSRSAERKSSSECRRERESQRDSYSQERDRERRRDRNPSRSPSVDEKDIKDKRGSSVDRRRSERTESGGSSASPRGNVFDVSKLKQENSIVGWDGQKSLLSRSMDEDRKRSSDKTMDEEYDDEFDQGRTKKVRRSRSLDPKEAENGVGNRFQAVGDRKKQVEQWQGILDGYQSGFRHGNGGSGNGDSKNWSNGGRNFSPRPNSGGSNMGNRPRHSSSHSSNGSNYSRSHGRSPYRNGHHSNSSSNGGNHYRSHSFHHGNKHWNSNDRNRH